MTGTGWLIVFGLLTLGILIGWLVAELHAQLRQAKRPLLIDHTRLGEQQLRFPGGSVNYVITKVAMDWRGGVTLELITEPMSRLRTQREGAPR